MQSQANITREFREKQIWAVRFRGGILLGLAALYAGLAATGAVPVNGYALGALVPLFVLNEIRRQCHRRGIHSDLLTELCVVADVLTIGVICYFTGGVESFFLPFLFIQVAGTSLHVNFLAGLKAAAGGASLFAILCALENVGALPHSPFMDAAGHTSHCLNTAYVASASLLIGFALFLAALSTGYVAKRLRVREEELAEANRQLVRLYRETQRLSITDELTGAFNRRHLMKRLAEEMSRSTRYERPFSIVMMDVDHFKKVNDAHGHPAGDAVLKEVAARAMGELRESDFLARYGGEEFAVLLPETSLDGAKLVAERIRERIAATRIVLDETELAVTMSLGVATLPMVRKEAADPIADILAAADARLYRAKKAGRNRVVASDQPIAEPAGQPGFGEATPELAHA
ncbi:MAG: GGDEF domain-containing protein [Candidatus Wallbacteria bacterium]|nr:GGDEF domain-containing protein [Candidatus Wallbacteria bacterium]